MQLNKVGPAMAQPNNKEYLPGNGRGSMSWRVTNGRVTSGMSMEDLKHQTALRLAHEQREDHCGPPTDEYPIINDRQATMQGYAPPQQQLQAFGSPAAAGYPQYGSQLSPGRLQSQPPPPQQFGYTRYDALYDAPLPPPPQQQHYDRNYADSQLGLASPGLQPLFSQPAILHSSSSGSSNNNARPNSYSTPRSRNAPLQDRGSAENRSFDGDHAGESAAVNAASAWSNSVVSPLKGVRVGSSSSLKKKKGSGKQNERTSMDGRVTPVKEVQVERTLYSTPNMRREISTSTPTSVYSEPQPSRTNKSSNHNSRSPRQSANSSMHSVRSPDFTCGRTAAPSNQPFYKHAPQQQSKLPHGLTVQELKEMTRARLAAEANYEADSVHSNGTRDEGQQQQDRTSPREYPLPPPLPQQNATYCAAFRKSSTDGISISSVPSNGNLNGYVQQQPPHPPHAHQHQQPHPQHRHQRMQQQQPPSMQYPYPRYPSPVYQQQFHSNNLSPVRSRSPAFGKPRTDTWETSSVASEYQVPELYAPTPMPSFSSPTAFNRGRCFSAGATITAGVPAPLPSYEASSWEDARPNPPLGTYYDTLQEANRRRCATMSPPGMSRLHEDRPFLFSGDEKEKLAIPPLSEPRPRFHSTGILGSAFEPISSLRSGMTEVHHHQGVVPPSPPSLLERVKFNAGDRMLSTGSNGDLPSSVAEAVLESLNASSGPMDLFDSHSPLRSFSNVEGVGSRKSPFRKSENNIEPGYPLDRLVTEESTGSGSLFSSGASKSIFSSEYSNNDRLLSITNSWGGEGGLENSPLFRFSQDFSNLLNIGNDGPGLRGRAATAPCFVENHPFVSQLDPEHNLEDHEKKLVSPFSSFEPSSSMPGMNVPGRSSNLPPGFNNPRESS